MATNSTATALPSEEAISRLVGSLESEAIRLLSDLIRFDSLLNNESAVQDYCAKLFQEYLSLEVDRFRIDQDALKAAKGYSPVDWTVSRPKENVVGIHRSKTKTGKTLIFNGHIDVVPVEGGVDQWSAPPFQPVLRDGRVYGRGSGDMKAGIVCFVIALRALRTLGFAPAADVKLQTVVEEECTGNGTLACLLRGHGAADLVLIPEPFPFLVTAQLGVMWFRVRIRGRPAHVLDTSAGINAIDAAYRLYDELRKLEAEYNAVERRHAMWRDAAHPINFNFGTIRGGDWPSSVPSACEFDVRVGFFPSQTVPEVQRDVEAALSRGASRSTPPLQYEVHYRGFQADGCVMNEPEKDSGLRLLQTVHADVLKRPLPLAPVTCTTDARHFALLSRVPVTCFGPEAARIHGIDESVSVRSMMEVAAVFAVLIARWCGLEPVSSP